MSKILLIEPDRTLANHYCAVLRRAGHSVKYCAQAATALKQVERGGPDLIILELQLPAHNGVEFLYEFRSYADWRDLPIIVVSQVPFAALGVSETIWEHLGVAGYHYKPSLTLRQLVAAVERTLERVHA